MKKKIFLSWNWLWRTHCGCLLGLFLILLCCTKLLVFGVTWQCNFIVCNILKVLIYCVFSMKEISSREHFKAFFSFFLAQIFFIVHNVCFCWFFFLVENLSSWLIFILGKLLCATVCYWMNCLTFLWQWFGARWQGYLTISSYIMVKFLARQMYAGPFCSLQPNQFCCMFCHVPKKLCK